MSRILLFGGSFNPVHYGHLRLAIEGLEQFQFDKVWMVPSGTPPHRSAYQQTSHQRVKLLELACSEHPQIEVCRFEVESQEVNYTVNTVSRLANLYPEHRFSFLTGLDVIYDHTWKGFEELLSLLELFLVASRPGYEFPKLVSKLEGTLHLERLVELPVPLHQVSSSLLRQRLSQGRDIHFWVSEKVRLYIQEHNLYRGPIEGSV